MPTARDPRPLILFVHGLFMPGAESRWFRRQLEQRHGFETALFSYPTTREPLDAVLDRLDERVEHLAPRALHVIGHSLGGVVSLRWLERHPDQPPGRVVFLGSPLRGSSAASAVMKVGFLAPLLGPIVAQELVGTRENRWVHADRPLGLIAGTRPMGFGQFFAGFQEPNDGTVAVRETEIDGAADHLVLPVSHMGMLLSTKVVEQTAHFLRHGRFALD